MMQPLHEQFVLTAKRLGSKTAVIDKTTEKTYSYEKLLIASLLMARRMKHYHDGFIGVLLPTSAGCMISAIGILVAGKVPVMINYSIGADENCEYAKKKCGFRTIVTARSFLEKIGCRELPGMVFIEDLTAEISGFAKIRMALKCKLPVNMILRSLPRIDMDDNAVILFTSGSEKDPRAVQLTHRNFDSNISDIRQIIEIRETDIILANLPLFHVLGHNICFWLILICGCTAVAIANPLEYRRICQIIREEKATITVATPAFFQGYLHQSESNDFQTVRLAVAGADKLPDSLRTGYLEKHNLEIHEGYGTTETSPVVSLNRPGANKPGSIGQVLPSVQVKIVDMNTGDALPPGQEGKILVKGDLVMKGYFDDIEETSLRIKDGWYDTGDMGMLDEEGYLWHRGRLRRFVKIGGEMVSLVRVETVLSEFLEDELIECCVVEIPDSLKGAKIVAVTTSEVNARKMLKKMAEKLPAIALPKEFLIMDELPKMGSGKIDFRTITERVRQRMQLD